jgi:hypothetical protein
VFEKRILKGNMWTSDRGRHTIDLGNELHGLTLHFPQARIQKTVTPTYVAPMGGEGGHNNTYEVLRCAIPVVCVCVCV